MNGKDNLIRDDILKINNMIEKEPNSIELWKEKAQILSKKYKFYNDSINAYSMALTYEPFNKELWRLRGIKHIPLLQFENAAADLEMASRIDRNNWDVLYHLGLAYYLLGDYERANNSYSACYKITEENNSKLFAIVDWKWLTLKKLGKNTEANTILEKVNLDIDGADNEVYKKRILVYKGILNAEELLKQNRSNENEIEIVTLEFGVGMHYLYNGKEQKAYEILENILRRKHCFYAFAYSAANIEVKRIFK